jgi:pimeloyl-ACP methyl ester carboxylesterase
MGSRDPDYIDPAAEATWMSETLHGEHRIVIDSGHYPHADAPDEVMSLALPFLKQVPYLLNE